MAGPAERAPDAVRTRLQLQPPNDRNDQRGRFPNHQARARHHAQSATDRAATRRRHRANERSIGLAHEPAPEPRLCEPDVAERTCLLGRASFSTSRAASSAPACWRDEYVPTGARAAPAGRRHTPLEPPHAFRRTPGRFAKESRLRPSFRFLRTTASPRPASSRRLVAGLDSRRLWVVRGLVLLSSIVGISPAGAWIGALSVVVLPCSQSSSLTP